MNRACEMAKKSIPIPWNKDPTPPSSISDKPVFKDEESPTEDRRLVNWKKWLADRRKHYVYYRKRTHRDYEKLLINASDKFRKKVEMNNLMEYAADSIPKIPDKYRALTKKQLNVAPEIERIAVPNLIRQEMGLQFKSEPISLWQRNEYLHVRKNQLSHELALLEHKEPEINELAVKGNALGTVEMEILRIPVITITGPEEFESQNETDYEAENAIVLKIQDREIAFSEDNLSLLEEAGDKSKRFTWYLLFQSTVGNEDEREIRLENKGICAIVYYWQCSCHEESLTQISTKSQFFFNKNKGIVLPGQIIVLPIFFESREPCFATEYWTLVTDPKISSVPLEFQFSGCCRPASVKTSEIDIAQLERDPNCIEQHLNRCVRDAEIHEIIKEILTNMETRFSDYKNISVESKMLMAHNLLCSFANRFETESEFVASNCFQEEHMKTEIPLKKFRRSDKLSSSENASKTSISNSGNSEAMLQESQPEIEFNSDLYNEVLYIRIRGILVDTIDQICAMIDTVNKFNVTWK